MNDYDPYAPLNKKTKGPTGEQIESNKLSGSGVDFATAYYPAEEGGNDDDDDDNGGTFPGMAGMFGGGGGGEATEDNSGGKKRKILGKPMKMNEIKKFVLETKASSTYHSNDSEDCIGCKEGIWALAPKLWHQDVEEIIRDSMMYVSFDAMVDNVHERYQHHRNDIRKKTPDKDPGDWTKESIKVHLSTHMRNVHIELRNQLDRAHIRREALEDLLFYKADDGQISIDPKNHSQLLAEEKYIRGLYFANTRNSWAPEAFTQTRQSKKA